LAWISRGLWRNKSLPPVLLRGEIIKIDDVTDSDLEGPKWEKGLRDYDRKREIF